MPKPDYDTSLARMAGNIASGILANERLQQPITAEQVAMNAVRIARAIISEVKHMEQSAPPKEPTP